MSDPEEPSTQPPSGWYPDPRAPWQQRYWDGERWGDFAQRPTGRPPKEHQPGAPLSRAAVGAFVLSLAGVVLFWSGLSSSDDPNHLFAHADRSVAGALVATAGVIGSARARTEVSKAGGRERGRR